MPKSGTPGLGLVGFEVNGVSFGVVRSWVESNHIAMAVVFLEDSRMGLRYDPLTGEIVPADLGSGYLNQVKDLAGLDDSIRNKTHVFETLPEKSDFNYMIVASS